MILLYRRSLDPFYYSIEFDIDRPSNLTELLALLGPEVTLSRPRLRYTRDYMPGIGRLIKPTAIENCCYSPPNAGCRVVMAHPCTFGGTLPRFITFTSEWLWLLTIYKYTPIQLNYVEEIVVSSSSQYKIRMLGIFPWYPKMHDQALYNVKYGYLYCYIHFTTSHTTPNASTICT